MNLVDPYYEVEGTDQEFKGRPPKIRIMSAKQHNKIVTWVLGLDRFLTSADPEAELTEFCKYLRVRLACGACLSEFRGFKVTIWSNAGSDGPGQLRQAVRKHPAERVRAALALPSV